MDEYIWPEITKETTIEEVKEIHRRIWDHVIANSFRKPNTPYFSNCAACEYAMMRYGYFSMCTYCPIKWPNKTSCFEDSSLYRAFNEYAEESKAYGRHLKQAMQYAEMIRDVEWKEGNND